MTQQQILAEIKKSAQLCSYYRKLLVEYDQIEDSTYYLDYTSYCNQLRILRQMYQQYN